MSPDEFREHGRRVVDWVAQYWERVETMPVLSQVSPGQLRARLPATAPESGSAGSLNALMADLDELILPGITHWQHPRFLAYFPANASGPSVLGDMLSSGLGVQGMLWATSPACTELEQVMLDWLVDLLDLPAAFRNDGPGGGVIQDSSSGANFVALQAALHSVTNGASISDGVSGSHIVYASSQTHSSVEKAARMAGLGSRAVRVVDVDPMTLAMLPEHLAELMAADRAAGLIPTMVAATIGTTSTTAIDPVPEIGTICRSSGVWLHIDAAFAGVAAVSPGLRWINDGVADFADSYCTDAHKWLLTNFDATAFWVRDRRHLTGALSIQPEYLRNAASESGDVVDYRDWQIELGRRFRALKLWMVIGWYGAEGLRAHIEGHVALAQELAGWVRADDRFEVVAPHPLSLVCFRPRWPHRDDEEADRRTMSVIDSLNRSGECYLTHTKVSGRTVIRASIGAPSTNREDVARVWELIRTEVAARS
ncbi:MAG: pyridoxal-dependent decarboxylase [Actinomycetota bacterium]|nr:pyridoxal-dependent decarboxylase [Actinomycetota bacterium]